MASFEDLSKPHHCVQEQRSKPECLEKLHQIPQLRPIQLSRPLGTLHVSPAPADRPITWPSPVAVLLGYCAPLALPNLARCVVALLCSSFLELGGLESAYVEYTLFGEVESNGIHLSVLANTYVCAGAVAVLQMHELLPSPSPRPRPLSRPCPRPYPHPCPPPVPPPLSRPPECPYFSLTLCLTRCF